MANSKTVEKTFKILELISNSKDGITLSEISKQLELPKSSCYDILQTLYEEDAIYYKDRELKTYVIGSKIYAIAQAYTKNSLFVNYSKDVLPSLCEKYHLTGFSYKRIEQKCVSIYKYESKDQIIKTEEIGEKFDLYQSVPGKVLANFMKESSYEKLLKSVPIDLYKKFKEDITQIKKCGYLLDDGIDKPYLTQYSVPIFNHENKVSGALYLVRMKQNESKSEVLEELKDIINASEYISKKQGYRGNHYDSIKQEL